MMTARTRPCKASRLTTALLAALLLAPVAIVPADATGPLYGPTTRGFDNKLGTKTTLGVRGYMDDACLHEDVWCLTDAANFKPEATAHAKVVRELSRTHNGTFHPQRDVQQDRVQWEARPASGNQWRVDAVVDRPTALGNFGMMEVKDWGVNGVWGAGVEEADNQLVGYLDSTSSPPYDLKAWRNDELNLRGWVKLYLDHLDNPGAFGRIRVLLGTSTFGPPVMRTSLMPTTEPPAWRRMKRQRKKCGGVAEPSTPTMCLRKRGIPISAPTRHR